MTDQPTAEANRYARLGPEAQALVDDFDALDLAEMLVSKNNDIAACTAQQWPQRLAAAEAELRRYTEAESADAAAGSYAGRAETAEQQRDQLAALVRDFLDPDPCQLDHHGYCQAHLWMCSGSTCPHARAREALAALDDDHAIAQPERWLHVAFTSPDEATANTSALAIADHLAAEFPGVGMRISSNAVEEEEIAAPVEPLAHAGGNAEDCPVCRPEIDKTVLYPWVCTEPDAAVDEDDDLTGAWTPDPPIGCLLPVAEPRAQPRPGAVT